MDLKEYIEKEYKPICPFCRKKIKDSDTCKFCKSNLKGTTGVYKRLSKLLVAHNLNTDIWKYYGDGIEELKRDFYKELVASKVLASYNWTANGTYITGKHPDPEFAKTFGAMIDSLNYVQYGKDNSEFISIYIAHDSWPPELSIRIADVPHEVLENLGIGNAKSDHLKDEIEKHKAAISKLEAELREI